jgi:GTP-binding protein HflX
MNRLIEMFDNGASEDTASGLKTVKSQDMLFATLDTAHRKISIGKGMDFILIDTVGFVSGLPHNLVEAFKSTLEEVKDADLLIHVVDNARADERDFQIDVTNKVISQLGAGSRAGSGGGRAKMIMAYNKMDIAPEKPLDASTNEAVYISAKTGENIESLVSIIQDSLYGGMIKAKLLIPYDKGNIVSYICDNTQVDSIDYLEDGTLISGKFKSDDYTRYKQYERQE